MIDKYYDINYDTSYVCKIAKRHFFFFPNGNSSPQPKSRDRAHRPTQRLSMPPFECVFRVDSKNDHDTFQRRLWESGRQRPRSANKCWPPLSVFAASVLFRQRPHELAQSIAFCRECDQAGSINCILPRMRSSICIMMWHPSSSSSADHPLSVASHFSAQISVQLSSLLLPCSGSSAHGG